MLENYRTFKSCNEATSSPLPTFFWSVPLKMTLQKFSMQASVVIHNVHPDASMDRICSVVRWKIATWKQCFVINGEVGTGARKDSAAVKLSRMY